MKKILLAALIAVFASSGLLSASSLESLRRSSENIEVNTSGLKKKSAAAEKTGASDSGLKSRPATAQYEITPTPVNGFAELIRAILKLLFSPNGDIEIQNPSTQVPEVEGVMEDDQEEETYSEGQAYDPVDLSSLPQDPFQPPAQAQQPQQPQQPQQQGQPRVDIGGGQGDRIPDDLRRKAMEAFSANQGRIENKRYIGVVDFAQHSSRQRFWIIDLQTGAERAMRVAHGTGSDPDGDGFATRFSNVPNSKASSLGPYLTGALYTGKHGKSMRLHGLSSTNSNALSRAVVVHDSNYVREANVRQGRSFGCLAVANSEIAAVLASLRGGALIYAGLSNSEF
ncbi:MAG: hypothetical protein A2X32_00305 [Elusimicrobia bacterium GWC2_64_44]|nr:MAG: hypothetical protein A2X32_00305 [Elusimicrobia bacterium GWC2_64_44]